MRELKVSLLPNVKVDKIRKSTEEERSAYLAKKAKKAQEQGKELPPETSIGEFIIQATQVYLREKDGRLIQTCLDIRTDLKLEEGTVYDIYASWIVEVQGVYLLKADIAHKQETKKNEK